MAVTIGEFLERLEASGILDEAALEATRAKAGNLGEDAEAFVKRLHRDGDLLQLELTESGRLRGSVFIEAVVNLTRAPASPETQPTADPVTELRQLMLTDELKHGRVKAEVGKIEEALPPGLTLDLDSDQGEEIREQLTDLRLRAMAAMRLSLALLSAFAEAALGDPGETYSLRVGDRLVLADPAVTSNSSSVVLFGNKAGTTWSTMKRSRTMTKT